MQKNTHRQQKLPLKVPYVRHYKDFKATIINMFKDLKESFLREVNLPKGRRENLQSGKKKHNQSYKE
jgi:hypothetical protein